MDLFSVGRSHRWLARYALGALLLALAGCGGNTHASTTTSHRPEAAGALVRGRSPEPTETSAHGIDLPSGAFNVNINHRTITITAQDWNTISQHSIVMKTVGVTLDPSFHATAVGRNRFQYLADRIAAVAAHEFRPVGIVTAPNGRATNAVDALVNLTDHADRLSGLHVEIVATPPRTTIGRLVLFRGANQSLVIPARAMYFLRVEVPITHQLPKAKGHEWHEETHFEWSSLVACRPSGC